MYLITDWNKNKLTDQRLKRVDRVKIGIIINNWNNMHLTEQIYSVNMYYEENKNSTCKLKLTSKNPVIYIDHLKFLSLIKISHNNHMIFFC